MLAHLLGYTRLINVTTRSPGGPYPNLTRSKFVFSLADTKEIVPLVAAGRRGFWPVPKRMLKEIVLPEHVLTDPL
jgi:hypothetical protein